MTVQFTELHRDINDRSRCDFHTACHLVERGYERATIEQAMYAASPDLEERKPGHVQDYVRRTVEAAVQIGSREREQAERALAGSRLPHTAETQRDATDLCRREIEDSARHIGDPAQRDLAAAVRLAEVGYGAPTIEQALRAASPNLEERTRGRVDHYVRVAAELALQTHARQLERDRDRGRDDGMEQ